MEYLDRLIAINQMLSSELELKPQLKSILSKVVEMLSCDAASIMFYDEDEELLNFSVSVGAESDELAAIPIPVEGSIAGLIFTQRTPMIINDVPKNPDYFTVVEERTGYQVRSLLGVPIIIRERTIGVLEGLNKIEGEFTEADAQLLSLVAAQTSVAINNAHIIEELQQANEELRQADKLKADFMAVASHELRTPLGIILGYATFLKEEAKGEFSEHAGTVHAAAMRLRALLEDMTNMNLLYTGATELRLRPIQIQNMIKTIFDDISQMAKAVDYQLEFIPPSQDLWVNADERLQKVFENLLNNAIRFTPPKGEIVVRISATEGEILVEVQDSGIGIHPNEVERIFAHFYQVEHHMRRRYEGLGLGLAIARGMVDLHHGRIWAESDGPGKGSTFKVLLPRFAI
ncbi:MAG: GAF domain-containing protein [Anaerolineales bacterium]|nr:GAF domain-containing protein [Chloroflexota bacterium]MBL6980848.1 GAF domain-containing protein [Anaerolineales bacterium]